MAVNPFPVVSVGDAFQGGIVGYIFQPGDPEYDPDEQRGLIVSRENIGEGVFWGCQNTEIGGTGEAIGDGPMNTQIILGGCSEEGIAAQLADSVNLNGWDDWYLLSRLEMQAIYANITDIPDLPDVAYWTSSEYMNQPSQPEGRCAYVQTNHWGGQCFDAIDKNAPRAVRA